MNRGAPSRRDVVSLFSGAGGLDAGLEQAGWNVVSATDLNRDSMATLRATQEAKVPVLGRDAVHLAGTCLLYTSDAADE